MPEAKTTPIRFKHRLEYWGVRFGFWLFRQLGRVRAGKFAGWLARTVGPRLKAHKTARNNLTAAMPELPSAEVDQILQRMWDNLGANVGEMPFVRDMSITSPYVEVEGLEILDKIKAERKPVLFLTAHYGQWELGAAACRYIENDVHIIYRAANNPLVEEFFQENRAADNCTFIPKGRQGARAMLAALKNKGGVTLLNDQKQNTGIPIPFFGRDAMTATAVADLAVRFDYPIVPMQPIRLENGRLKIIIHQPIFAKTDGARQENVVELLTRINHLYEDWIRERPDHWFWVHNRW
ncbi:MAG: lysophospholipid acyltransferase family protein [Sneathiella sp.]|nr:lysophospholipid acyltransferase family protein [Sneathiella sp.]